MPCVECIGIMLTQRKKRHWIILPAAMVVLLLFFGYALDLSFIENFAMRAMSPFSMATLKVSDGAASAMRAFFDLKDVSAENAALREENRRLLREQALRAELEKENEALRRQVGVESRKEYALVQANIAHFDPLSFSYFATIDKGARDGMKENMPVIMAGDVAFGKIAEVHDGFSRVMLISNAANKVSVATASGSANGVISGVEGSSLRMDLIEKTAEIGEGEMIVTSGLDGAYPRGLVVGWVANVFAPEEGIFKKAAIRPAFENGFTTTVFIITDYLQ